jgi:proteasome alpha subunit
MIEEPYRWIEAIANRREYIEGELASGSPITAVSYDNGILLLTLGRERQKVFEIYDRIALGAIGHPGDIERLRLAAIEAASTEGFTRSAMDVSLRRLAAYALSPALKTAFEQVYGAPILARVLFAELGRDGRSDLFLRLEYDGSFHTNGSPGAAQVERWAAIAGTRGAQELVDKFLRETLADGSEPTLERAFHIAIRGWGIGAIATGEEAPTERPGEEAIIGRIREHLGRGFVEAAVLERDARTPVTFRILGREEIGKFLAALGIE